MKLIQIPDNDTYVLTSSIKSVKLFNPRSGDFAIQIISIDGTSNREYWLKTEDKEVALEILSKFIEDFNKL